MLKVLLVSLVLFLSAHANVKLSQNIYKKITNIQKLTSEKKYDEALALIKSSIKKDMKKGDLAYLLQSRGFIYISQNKYKKAIESFEKMNSLNVMGEQNYLSTIYNLAQLNMGVKNYKQTIKYLNKWLSKTKVVKAEAYVMLGQSYSLLEKPRKSIVALEKAVATQKKLNKKVPENWYELLFSNYYLVKDYKGAIDTLEILVKLSPKKKDYWIYLSQIHSLEGDSKKALSIFEQAYNLNILKSKDILHFTKFLFQNKLYYKSAKLLDTHITNKDIEKNEKNLKLLFDTYFSAKEYNDALQALDKLAVKTKKSKYHLQKARVYHMINDTKNAIKSYEKALKDKKLKEYHQANLELSYLYHEQGLMDKCKNCLLKAKKDKRLYKVAASFLQQVKIN